MNVRVWLVADRSEGYLQVAKSEKSRKNYSNNGSLLDLLSSLFAFTSLPFA